MPFLPPSWVRFGVGFIRYNDNDTYGSYGVFQLPRIGMSHPVVLDNQYVVGMPQYAVTNDGTGEMGVSLGSRGNLLANNGWSTFVTFTKVKGDHP